MNVGAWNPSGWPVQFASPLGPPFWAVLIGVPVGIIALYFLKLRRRPVQVSSTLLWRRSLEDLHVNSLFQRLRKNLLLFLQLLAVLLAMFALLGPRVKGSAARGSGSSWRSTTRPACRPRTSPRAGWRRRKRRR